MFEDIEAQVLLENQNHAGIAELIASARSARIVVNGEGIVVTNLVFGRDFSLATHRDAVIAVLYARIESIEVLAVYDSARAKANVRLHEWVSQTLIGRMVRVRVGSADGPMGVVFDCDRDWLLIERASDSTKCLVSMRSIFALEVRAVHNQSVL